MSNLEVVDPAKEKLRKALHAEIGTDTPSGQPASSEYHAFKRQYLPAHLTRYEQLCQFAESLGLKPDDAEAKRYEDAIATCHLHVTPKGVYGLAVLSVLVVFLFGLIVSLLLPLLLGSGPSLFFLASFSIVAMSVYSPIRNLPFTFAQSWRMRASNQMVLCMFYITTYMRQNSNLERAIDFSAEHIGAPLALDLKKVIWDVQTEQFGSVQESLDHYLVQWKDTNLEFVESMNLVQSSLYETSQERRLKSLEKAMDIILEETYEKMLHYAQNLKSPMTMLHMLGIILPILGLVILPLAVSFIEEVRWYHISMLYNVLLPVGVFYLGMRILSDRPTGYGSVDITEINPELKKFQGRLIKDKNGIERAQNPKWEAWLLGGFLVCLGLLPLLLHAVVPDFDYPPINPDKGSPPISFLGYRTNADGVTTGPYGLGAAVLSLFITLGAGLGIAHYYSLRSRKLIQIRDETKQLEQEFAGALFQLGNRLGDGIPVELAFSKVADVMEGTKSGQFFRVAAVNIQKMGMSPEQAVFDARRGAINLFPSSLIESSMKVLFESARKGPAEASQALINMSNYIKEIHRVDERLKDLMSDIISGMRSQISFLTPAIAGIVIGITSMITTILGQLQEKFEVVGDSSGTGAGGLSALSNIGLGAGIPTYYFQPIVGLYVVQITWILAYLVNGIENGEDKLNREFEQGKGLGRASMLFCAIALVVMLIFNIIAGTILSNGLA